MLRMFRLVMICILLLSISLSAVFAGGAREETADPAATVITGLTNYDPRNEEDAETQAYIHQKQKFLANNPDIEIDEEILSHGDLVTKTRTLAAANEMPNFFKLRGDVVTPFAAGQAISTVDYILNENPEFRDLFLDGVFENFIHDGRIYGVPVRSSAHLVFYNQQMLQEAGINSFPETWTEFAEAVDALNDTHGDNPNFRPVALGARAPWIINNYFSHMTLQNAGLEWYENLRNNAGAAWTDQPVLEVAQKFRELVDNNSFNPDLASIDQNQQRALFYTRDAAMFFSGNWATGFVYDEAPDEIVENTKVASYPEFTNGAERGVIAGGAGWGFGINHRGDDELKEILARVITQIFNKDFAIEMAERGAIPPMSLSEDEYDASGLSRIARETNELVGSLRVLPVMDHQLPAAMMETISSEVQMLLIDEVTPVEFTENLQATWNEILAGRD